MSVSWPIPDWHARRRIALGLLLGVTVAGIFFALLLPYLWRLNQPPVGVGQVAEQDYVATSSLSYESQVLTEDLRDNVERGVEPIYTSVDTSIARRQLERLRAALDFITNVRADAYATTDQKLVDLSALQDLSLSTDTEQKILALSDVRWLGLSQEAIAVLEQVMRSMIRADRLTSVQGSLPALVSLSLPEDQAVVVVDLVRPFVAPNSFYDSVQTQTAVDQALAGVKPVVNAFVVGQTIVPRGKVIGRADLEALQVFGLAKAEENWREIASAGLLTILASLYILIYVQRTPAIVTDIRRPFVLTAMFLIFLWGARLFVPNHVVVPYLFPTAAFALTVCVLFGSETALFITLPLSILISYQLPRPLELTIYMVLGSFFGVWMLQRAQRFTTFFVAGGVIVLVGLTVVALYRLTDPSIDLPGLLSLGGAVLINGIASVALSLILHFFLAQFLGMISPLQLIELTRPDQPLLQFILRSAPGTYQHSLQVANLAEQAAEQIGADALLTRVGALYHDAGKANNPFYFIENQMPGELNPHDDIDPVDSAAKIIQHVSDGLVLANQYRMPRRIRDFISEHHGNLITRYQYVKAVQKAGGDESLVNMEDFRYPGPSPRSKETALLMLADGCEARVRAERPKDELHLRRIIREVIESRLKSGELNATNLTLRQLEMVGDSFYDTLRGLYHPRIAYPDLAKKVEAPSALPAAELPAPESASLAAVPTQPAPAVQAASPDARPSEFVQTEEKL